MFCQNIELFSQNCNGWTICRLEISNIFNEKYFTLKFYEIHITLFLTIPSSPIHPWSSRESLHFHPCSWMKSWINIHQSSIKLCKTWITIGMIHGVAIHGSWMIIDGDPWDVLRKISRSRSADCEVSAIFSVSIWSEKWKIREHGACSSALHERFRPVHVPNTVLRQYVLFPLFNTVSFVLTSSLRCWIKS